jgi:hypothetical protein
LKPEEKSTRYLTGSQTKQLADMDICVAIIFGLWLLISIIWQFQFKSLTTFKEFDFIGIFPNWTFFAPNPGTSDYHIVYRLAQNDTVISEWMEIPLISYRTYLNSIWNPEKRKVKLLIDCINALIKTVQKCRKEKMSDLYMTQNLCTSVPYLLILNAVTKFHKNDEATDATHLQFTLVESFGIESTESAKPIISSPFHRVR